MAGKGVDSDSGGKDRVWRKFQKSLDYFDVDVSTAVLAEILGRSDRWVRELAERGVAEKVAYGRFGLLKTIRAYVNALAETASGRSDDEAPDDLDSEDARLKRERRINWELKNRELAGGLVDAEEVERAWSEEFSRLRTAMLSVKGRVASKAPHLSKTDLAILDEVVRKVLAEAAGTTDGDASRTG